MGGIPGAPGSCPGAVEVEEVARMTGLFPGGAGRHSSWASTWRPMSCELLRGDHLRSTISSLGEIICLPQGLITRISLGRNGAWLWAWCDVEWNLVVEQGSAWKWWPRRWVTLPWCRWWMNLIRLLPELSVFARCISTRIMWSSYIVIWALLWAKQPTGSSHNGYLWRRTIRRNRMWTNDGSNQMINSIGDFERCGVWLRILKVAVTFSGMKASYMYPSCHKLWCFTWPSIPWNPAKKKKSQSHTSCRSLLYALLPIVGSLMEAHLCSVPDCKDHRRDTTWYLHELNKNSIRLDS